MKCVNCNAELSEGMKFCPYCGKEVVLVSFCPDCGTKLVKDALFCHNCGKKFGEATSKYCTKKGGLDLSNLDPIPFKTDYYGANSSVWDYYKIKHNNGWLMNPPEYDNPKTYTFVNENTFETVCVDIADTESNSKCLGFNNLGIWIKSYNIVNVYDLEGKEIYCIDLGFKNIDQSFIICGEELFYWNTEYISEQSCNCPYTLESCNAKTGETKIWFTMPEKDCVTVTFCSVNKDYIAVKFYTCPDATDKDGMYLVNRSTGETTFLNKDCNDIQICYIFLDQGYMWTSATEIEEQIYNINYSHLVKREIGVAHSMPVICSRRHNSYTNYFDGDMAFVAKNYWELKSENINTSEENTISSGDGHGDTNRLIVTNKNIIVNYDAYALAMLPKNFSSFTGYASANPEVSFPFGQKDIRL